MERPILLLVVFTSLISAFAQAPKTEALKAPKTKLEAFDAKTGTVVIRGFSTTGTLDGQMDTSAVVEAREITEAASGKKEYGIAITLVESAKFERKEICYVDYDEIDSLLKGIDYVTKLDKSVTDLERFEAEYKTKGDFSVATFTERNNIQAALQCGGNGGVTVFLTREQLSTFKDLIQKTKSNLDSAKSQPAN